MYTQIDGVAMGLPIGPILANTFLLFYEKMWLERCLDEFKPVYYSRYVNGIFIIFKSQNHLTEFRDHLNKSCSSSMKFSFEHERNKRLSFLVVASIEGNKVFTTVYRIPTFSDV